MNRPVRECARCHILTPESKTRKTGAVTWECADTEKCAQRQAKQQPAPVEPVPSRLEIYKTIISNPEYDTGEI